MEGDWSQVAALALTLALALLKWWLSGEGEKRREKRTLDRYDRALARGDAHRVGGMLARRTRTQR